MVDVDHNVRCNYPLDTGDSDFYPDEELVQHRDFQLHPKRLGPLAANARVLIQRFGVSRRTLEHYIN